jgi:threonylcarbamoyladenosine tRNA methylthiotransferase MtaB
MAAKYRLTTLGCKVNQYESQQLREVVESFGLRPAWSNELPDIAVVNTCAVTASAARKNRQAIRQVACGGLTPVIVVGCGASADAQGLRALDGVAAVWGHDTDVCAELRKLLAQRLESSTLGSVNQGGVVYDAPDRSSGAGRDEIRMKPVASRHPGGTNATQHSSASADILSFALPVVKSASELVDRIEAFAGHQRAFLKVQDGCDAYCTYCIIPQLRPVLRSKPIEVAVAEARTLVRAGHKEIILTGIFLGAYGRSTAIRKRFSAARSPFANLVEALARVEGLERLRLSSLEPGDVDESLLEILATHRTCVPHLHLPLQSGSERVLRRMNRQYTVEAFVEMIGRIRRSLDRPAISTDIIVGFPGETEADFEASLEVARFAEFCKIHAFPFSPRERTAAARWQKEFVHPAVVRERIQRLAEVERECSTAYRRRLLGSAERVIVEPSDAFDHDLNGVGIRHGRADRYFEIHFEADRTVRTGDLVPVRIDRITPTRTHGAHLNPRAADYPLPVMAAARAFAG